MTKYVPYYRVSTKRQGHSGLGLEAQEAAVRRHLREQDALMLPPFVEVESGRRRDRPELAKALAKCRAKGATLIVAKVDRLSRSAGFLDQLLKASVPVVFCDLPNVNGAVGKFLLQQMAAVAELEAGLISERTKAALAARVARLGQWDRKASHHLIPGNGQPAAVAATKAKAGERALRVQDDIEEIRAAGTSSLGGIAKALNDRGIPSPRGGRWQAVTVQRVLARL
jgi:DNA invertase Pin-like site-specific DNA recombinase